MTKKVAAVLTIIGGVFYIIGGLLGFGGLLAGILRIGLFAGPIIMVGGVLVNSKVRRDRVAGGLLAIVGVIFAGAYWCGGLIAGLVLTFTGSISGLAIRSSYQFSKRCLVKLLERRESDLPGGTIK
jgi:hypothetical protein